VPTFVNRGVSRGQRGGSPTVVNLSFLERSCCFFFQVAPHLSSQGLSGHVPQPAIHEVGWTPEQVWTIWHSTAVELRPLGRPARNHSKCRLSYRGSKQKRVSEDISGRKTLPAREANNLTVIYEPIVHTMCVPQRLVTLQACTVCYEDSFTFLYVVDVRTSQVTYIWASTPVTELALRFYM
jgi:hypothetical protein